MKKTLVLLMVLLLTGCTPKPQKAEIYAMDTVMTIEVWGDGAQEALAELERMLYDWDRELSVTREDSLVWRLNAGQSVPVDEALEGLISGTCALARETKGALDPCLYPITRLWGFTTGTYRVPTQTEIQELLPLVGYDKLTLKDGVAALAPGAQADFGAVAKGWAGATASQYLRERGDVERALLSLGGNIQTFGTKPGGEPWQVGIQSPNGSGLLGIVSVTGDWSVVTSGGYQRYFEEDGVRYSHIMNPATGRPVESGLASVTVLCRDGLRADGLSTALTVMGLEGAIDFWREYRDFEAVFLTDTGEIYATPGSNLSDCSLRVIGEEP